MAKLSRQTKEIIKTVLVLVIIAVVVVAYIVYPLMKTAVMMGRPEGEAVNIDSLPPNDPAAVIEAGFAEPDTFRVDADGLTSLACVRLAPSPDSADTTTGTVLLLHRDRADRSMMLPLAKRLTENGMTVILYDQRASGLTSGKYRGDGSQEATDLLELLGYLHIRDRLQHPVTVVGYELGADAALLAVGLEKRIDRIVAIDPYLTTDRLLDRAREVHGIYSFPFFRPVMWWWYGIRSGYVTTYHELDGIEPVACPTLLIHAPDRAESAEIARLKALRPPAPDTDGPA